MKKICAISGQTFIITDEQIALCEKMQVPVPEICWEEHIRQLMALRNEWNLFRRHCDKTGETIISAYPEDVAFPVWKNELWWGDNWDATEYGRDFDFDKLFFEQFQDLRNEVPREGTSVFRSENCAYNGHVRDSKNCYLNSLVAMCEDTYYSYWVVRSKDLMDCVMTNNSELCYDCMDAERCYECVKVYESVNCANCYFSFQLRGCKNCIGCSNLTNKEYYAFNKHVGKDEFEKIKAQILNGSYKTYQQGEAFLQKVLSQSIHKATNNTNSEGVIGNHMYNSKNCINCFDGHNSEDCWECISLDHSNDIYRCYSAGWTKCELVYSSAVSRGSTNIAFCYYTFYSQNLRYCDSCNYCQDCFGCIGLKHKQYCIFNKQYTREAYEAILPKIIEHMKKTGEFGKFFPINLSAFPYNHSVAQDYFPMEKSDAVKAGHTWKDQNIAAQYDGPQQTLPDTLSEVDDSICDAILTCDHTGKNYRIIPPELKFYQKMNLPLPRLCPEERHKQRMAWRKTRHLWDDTCDQCQKNIKSSYASDRTETVYCRDCYLKAVN